MKPLRHLISLLMICTGLVLVQGFGSATTASEAPSQSKPDPSLLQELKDSARGSVKVAGETATKKAGFIRAGLNGDLLPSSDAGATDKARAFLDKYGALLGATDSSQLRQTDSKSDKYGTTVTYTQEYKGLPVFGGTILAHLDKAGDLTAVNGTAVPNLSLSTTPALSSSEIGSRAVRYIRAEPPTSAEGKAGDTTGIRAKTTELMVYRTGLIRGDVGTNELAYRVEVTNGANIRDIVFMEAGSGKVLNRYSMIHDALERELYEVSPDTTPVWEEGDPFPGALNEEQQNLVLGTGESYQFFLNSFGRDSYDDAGATMRTVNNDPRIACPNANWNGTTTNYCNGVTSDDVVAHEWGHAYTEFTHGLIYQWQPGALNESYSDIWGETVDLINERQDEDETNQVRTVGRCSSNTGALPVLTINTPADIAQNCPAGAAAFGPPLTESGTTGDVAVAVDASDAAGPSTTDACTAITNGAAVSGKVALVDRGTCGFTVKVKNAQNAGAIAVVVGNNTADFPGSMSGTDPTITIPSLMISQANRNVITGKLATEAVNVTLRIDDSVTDDSFRWLVSEDSFAFGGAIRDMWNPNCVNDPGKVTDAQYQCSTADGGGVHSNSGVPNHGYALLVDGGTFNGQTIEGIGLTRAAHIYWRAQSTYQTETTDFVDHADALEQSCTDLIDADLEPLSTAGAPGESLPAPEPLPADGPITADTCAQLSAAIAAVELRTEPTQCNFQPLLAKNAPSVCDANAKRNIVWKETFDDGLDGWTLSNAGVFPGWADTSGGGALDWAAESDLPGDRNGSGAFALDRDDGSCGDPATDVSGVMSMQSEPILIPGSNQRSPRLTFMHYVATENGFDGGNLKVSVNDGAFNVVPETAYIFNKPVPMATAGAGNTSPLAGQPGFTGTDGGEVTGSWGQSQIDLTMLGAESGDSVELRFDFGMDGCGAIDGWYVDNVVVSTCKAKTQVTATQSPRPSRYGNAPRVNVVVESLGGQGAPTGEIAIRKGGRTLGSATLDSNDNGRARVFLPARMSAGLHNLVARYTGEDLHASSSDAFTVRVAKAATTTRLQLTPNPVQEGRRLFANIDTTAPGIEPDGRVQLRFRGDVLARGFMQDGHIQFVIDRNIARGQHTMRAIYLGNNNIGSSNDTATVRVVR